MSEISATANNSYQRLYDLRKLIEISQGNEAFVKKMIRIFYERIPFSLEQMKNAFAAKDFKKVRDIAHLLKPGIDNMDITSIKINIRNIENLAINDTFSDLLEENINMVENILMEVHRQLQLELN